MGKLSKQKQWDKAIRHFERVRILTTKFDGEVKLVELGLALRGQTLKNEEIITILQRQTYNSLNRIRDQINRDGGHISEEWVAQVVWVRNMASHSVVWDEVFMYAPTNVEETRRVLKISGITDTDAFSSPIHFTQENADTFLEIMRFCASTLAQAHDELKKQIVGKLDLDQTSKVGSIGTTITMQPHALGRLHH